MYIYYYICIQYIHLHITYIYNIDMDLINGIDTVISYMYMGTGQRSVPQELNGEYWTYTKKCGPIRLTDWPTPYIYTVHI